MSTQQRWQPSLGAEVLPDGVRFRVWAPKPSSVAVRVVGPGGATVPMVRGEGGVFEAFVPKIGAGTDYEFVLDGERARPDPRSRFQPQGVHGPSRVVDPSTFTWSNKDFRGPPQNQLVIYELHTGTFTPEGTFAGVATRLRRLADLGITAIELMPVAEFPGNRNWGYDGASLFAPHSAYGGPDGLRALVDACHAIGIAVILDVVYNHLGPEGNYLGEFGPYFTERYRTPWGQAVNYDDAGSDEVRRFVVENAVSWLAEYHIDGLRLDAIHSIFDQSALPLLEELTTAFHAEAARNGTSGFVIAESDLNDPRVVRSVEAGGLGLDAQWSDDFHHAVHAVCTGDKHGYFGDFGRVADVATAIEKRFVYDGKWSAYRGRRHGREAASISPDRFVVCTQNHDQIANGSGGERGAARLAIQEQKILALLLLLTPTTPLLFMGQEYGETAPFHYFTSHGDEALGRAVTAGRREELRAAGWDKSFHDPQDPQTFELSKLAHWGSTKWPHAELWQLHRDLLRFRREVSCFRAGEGQSVKVTHSETPRWLRVDLTHPDGTAAQVFVNFESEPLHIRASQLAKRGWSLAFWTGDPLYGGPRYRPQLAEAVQKAPGSKSSFTIPARSAVVYTHVHRKAGDAASEKPTS